VLQARTHVHLRSIGVSIMRIRKLAASAALGLAAVALSACATGLNTRVTRYQPASIPAGQSFAVVPFGGAPNNEFTRYSAMVSQQLEAQGYRNAAAPQDADMLVRFGYGVDEGRTEIVQDPYFPSSSYGWGGFGGWGIYGGRPYWSRWSGYPFYYGWDDPFWYGGYGGYGGYGRIHEYTVYKSQLDMDIVRRSDGAPLFEGHAQARSETDELDALVPNLVDAMFTGFPGKNGETVKITIPARKK
jgi:hypothetical protein